MNNYFAKSFIKSKTIWFNIGAFIVAASELSEFTKIIPIIYMPNFLAIIALINLALRMFTVRPIALIGLDQTKPVPVKTLNA